MKAIARIHLVRSVSSWDIIELCINIVELELRAGFFDFYIGITLHKPIILETNCVLVAFFLANENFDKSLLISM